jgi:ABC-2 type transport system ATP-binding protein
MSEMALTADRLIVIGAGRLIADRWLDDVIGSHDVRGVLVRAADPDSVTAVLTAAGGLVTPEPDGALLVTGLDGARIGALAVRHALPLSELTPQRPSLEEAFMELTRDSVEFAARSGGDR